MKLRIYYSLLVVEAVGCVVLATLRVNASAALAAVFAFPFQQIGSGLRALSLSGAAGNAFAIVIYVIIGLAPLVWLVVRRRFRAEDLLLVLLSPALLGALYLFINPGLISLQFGSVSTGPTGRAVVGAVVYSIIVGYIVLRALRAFAVSPTDRVLRYLAIVLALLGAGFVYAIFGSGLATMLEATAGLFATWFSASPGVPFGPAAPGDVGAVWQWGADALSWAMALAVVVVCLQWLDEYWRNRFSEEAVAGITRVSRVGVAAVAVMVVVDVASNVFQVLAAGQLTNVNVFVIVPLPALAFVLLTLLLTRLAAEDKQLKDDQDMII